MAHTKDVREDGLRVLVVTDLNARHDPKTGKPLSYRPVNDVLVHASAIAEYYGIPMRDIGQGDNRVPGIWSLVHENVIGLRVNYNSEEAEKGNRLVRKWIKIPDAAGNPIATEQKIVEESYTQELDDGMYVRLKDLLEFAAAQGWTKGGGRPKHEAPVQPQVDVAAIVAAVLAALGHAGVPAASSEPKQAKGWTDERRKAAGDRLRAAREAKQQKATADE